MKADYIKQAWLVLALAVCFGGGLAGVQVGLSERIESNKREETLSQIPELVPGAATGEKRQVGEARLAYEAFDAEGRRVGWVLPAGGQGFADRIELLIGTDARARVITGLYILAQKETPGLGNKIVEDRWRQQFEGMPTDEPVRVIKGAARAETDIEAVTGATISSDSVVATVNRAVRSFREALAREGDSF